MSAALECRALYAGYGDVPAVRDLSLTVHEGEIVALLGVNGAGKTTTLQTVTGILPPLGGSVSVLGEPVAAGRPDRVARRGVSYVPDDRGLFHSLSGWENLRLARPDRGRKPLEHFREIEPRLHLCTGLLSGGEQQMLAIERALASTPRLLLVDELSLGLAPVVVERLLPALRQLADERGIAILLVEQHVGLALEVADRGYILSHGQLVLEGNARWLAQRREVLIESYLGEAALVSDELAG
jgi:branched-chain amino acid transport system ATP-binding protein